MDKRIVFKTADGSIGIISPAPNARGEILMEKEKRSKRGKVLSEAVYRAETDSEFLTRIAMLDVPADLEWRIVDVKSLPVDRTFRGAWTDDGKISVCMAKARKIHMDNIRVKRHEKFVALGFPYRLNASVEAILPDETRKELQRLRDIPQTVNLENAKTVEELIAVDPV